MAEPEVRVTSKRCSNPDVLLSGIIGLRESFCVYFFMFSSTSGFSCLASKSVTADFPAENVVIG